MRWVILAFSLNAIYYTWRYLAAVAISRAKHDHDQSDRHEPESNLIPPTKEQEDSHRGDQGAAA
jgi:hypothetical protein